MTHQKPFRHKQVSHTFSRIKKRKKNILRTLFFIVLFLFLLSVIGFFGMIGWFSRDLPNPDKLLDRSVPLSTKIYDRTGGHLLYEIHGAQQRSLITIRDIPESLKKATITAEDKGFYSHKGFDIRGIVRSIIVDIISRKKAQGGSTITQQFIKNSLLTSRKTFARKIKELVLAYQLEKQFSKDKILQMYFNEIPYGSTAYGVQAASKMYFGKNVQDLTLAESAYIAALPKAPTYYSPWGTHKDLLDIRKNKILSDMADEEYISKEEALAAQEEKVIFKSPGQGIEAPHFVMYVKDLLADAYGEKRVEEGGLKVITTLDYDKQKFAEQAIQKQGEKNINMDASNAALFSLDAKTGEILAMVGSRDYHNMDIDGNVNVVLSRRQPGSSFKPIVYAAAFQKGYTPDTILFDIVTNFDTTGTKEYTPHNYTGKEYGPVSLRQALAGSLNIPAVKLLYLVGVPHVIEFASTLGYTSFTDPDRYGLSLVLGGAEVTLFEHTAAFTSFAQEGKRVTPIAILRVEDEKNTLLQKFKNPITQEVFNPDIARTISSILSDQKAREFVFGAHTYLTLSDRPVAVKTGTTNDNRDAWTIGYTPSLATGVWVGNNNNTPMKKGADGSKVAAPIWNEFMTFALKDTPLEPFTAPQPITTDKDVLNGKIGKEQKVKIDSITGKLATEFTPQELIQEKTFIEEIHTILYYIQKDDPRGPIPEHPEQDPQFAQWEKGVREWVKKQHIIEQAPPTESDTLHTAENIPTVTILRPQENETITQNSFTATINTSALQGVSRVEYFLDDTLLDTVFSPPFTLSYIFSGVENGFHTLFVRSYDSNGNIGSASITLNILLSKKYPYLQWISPLFNASLKKNIKTSLAFSLSLPEEYLIKDISKIDLFLSEREKNTQNIIVSFIQPSSKNFTFPWTSPSQAGRYTLLVKIYNTSHGIIFQQNIPFTIQ
jgi:1A family penicillin-binding protein